MKSHSFTDLLKVVILELPKLPEKGDEAVWPWLQFFKCKKQEEFEMLAMKHPELKEAVSCVKKMSLREQWQWIMLDRQNAKMAEWGRKEQIRLDLEEARTKALTEGHAEGHAEGMAEGHAEGHAEGLAEGTEKGTAESKLEIARKMKSMGDTAERIHTITGLSLETIEKM
jgi:predicted transposase/invertase (TIGR01784 family)